MKDRVPLVLAAVLLGASLAFAQFDDFLNKVKNALPGGNSSTNNTSTTDTLAAAGQMMRGIAGIGPKEENEIGDSVALEIVGRYGGLLRDAAVTRYVNLLGKGLARYSDRPDLNWRFGVLNSDTVNAFSAPGGWVFITRGLYNVAHNSAALAGVLGHEIAHITNRDALKIVARGTFLTGAANLAAARSSDARNVNGALQQFDSGIGQIANTLFEKGFDPQTEFGADQRGHDLAKMTGYPGGGLRSVLVHLEQHGGDSKAAFPTHPPLSQRIRRLPDEPAPRL